VPHKAEHVDNAAQLEDLGQLEGIATPWKPPGIALDGAVHVRSCRLFMATCSGLTLLVTGLLLLSGDGHGTLPLSLGELGPAALSFFICLISLAGLWLAPPARYRNVVTLLMALVVVLAVTVAVLRDQGVASITLAMMSLMVAMCTALNGLRMGLAMAGFSLLLLCFVGSMEYLGAFPAMAGAGLSRGLIARFGAQLLLLGTGLVVGLGTLHIITSSLAQVADRSDRFRRLLAMAADWYWEMDSEFRFTHVTEDKPGASGLEPDHRLGRTPWEIDNLGLSEDEMDAHRADLEAHRAFYGVVARRTLADGSARYVSISGEPRFDAHGSFLGFWGVGRDVTHEVRAEQAIQATEGRYRELFRRSPSPLVLHRWGRVIDANPAAMAMFGYTQRSSMIGQDLFSHYEPGDDERARVRAAKIEAMASGTMMPMSEFRLRTLSRRRLLVQATSVRVDAASGPATLSFFVDQTEQARAQDALRRSESLLSHLVATSPDVITLTDMQTGRYAMANKTFERLSGYSADEIIGRTAAEIGIWSKDPDRDRMLQQVRQQGRVNEMPTTFTSKQGESISMLLSAAPFEMDGQDYLVINARDVTDNERTRLAHEAILQNASIGIAFTRDQLFVQANPAVEDMFGWARGGLLGQHGSVIWPSADDYARIGRELGPRLASGEQVEAERTVRRRDGSTFLCRLLAKAVDPTHPSRGGTIWILEDITERRRVEAALAQAKDEAQAANRAKSAFLANTSHEIRTPLNGLLGLARLSQQPDLDEDTRRHYLNQMLDSAESLSGLISDILDLSKIEAGRLTLEHLPFALREMLGTMRMAYLTLAHSRGLEFKIDIDADVSAWVVGDPVRTRQILSNYLTNALKFTAQGSVSVRVRRIEDGRLRFEVADTGPGIDAEMRVRLFQPFTQADESTTRRYGGTGLGLSICAELAELMGGTVGADSVAGEGSVFWAELPLPATNPPVSSLAHTTRRHNELQGVRVLMAEDNPVNMMIAVALLEQWGMEVAQASDGSQAVEAVVAAASTGKPFDVVLMDVQMPVMSGHEATRIIRKHYSARNLPIIALTAAALVSERDEALSAGMNDFLTKPIDAPRLRQVLTDLMGDKDFEATIQ
jgi:PAS domain S-box-containing protein